MTAKLVSLSVILMATLPGFSVAHPGRTDSSGGHNDRKHGGYHYHGGGPSASSSSVSRPEPKSNGPADIFGVTSSLSRTTARTMPRTVARVSPPQPRTEQMRTYESGKLGSDFALSPEVEPEKPPAELNLGPAVESKDETKARKLLDYAERQRASGKVESATRWARWVISNYGRTTVATESKLILEEWKSSEPFRTWKDVTGKFKIVAKFLRLDTGNVYLLTETTKEISVAIKRLSRVDQDYVIAREGL